ncbi:hypothetical protein, partial [Peribacillus muralis]|uniref:hypothetical protein n=1 Tax=Peribacillus muralis TaxID=264697 RepID=UPI003671A4EB
MNEIIFRKAFEEIEKTPEFKSINEDISRVFYSLYLRCKRLYLTTALIRKTNDKDITHIES